MSGFSLKSNPVMETKSIAKLILLSVLIQLQKACFCCLMCWPLTVKKTKKSPARCRGAPAVSRPAGNAGETETSRLVALHTCNIWNIATILWSTTICVDCNSLLILYAIIYIYTYRYIHTYTTLHYITLHYIYIYIYITLHYIIYIHTIFGNGIRS